MLIPKGVYVTFENIKPMTPEGIVIGKELWKQFQISRGRDLATAESHMKRFGVEYQPITIEEHLDLLRKTGVLCGGTALVFGYAKRFLLH